MKSAFLSAVAVLVFAGTTISAAQKSNPNPDEQAIRKLDKDWSAAAGSKDVDKTVSFYSDDASALPFNAPIANGKDQIRQVWAHLTSLPGFALSFGPTKIEVAKSGDLAYDVGTFELKTNDAQGNTTTEVGKYTVVWKKQADGSWKFALDLGVGNPEPKDPLPMWPPGQGQMDQEISAKVSQQLARSGLLEAERKFSQVSAELGARESFLLYAAKDVRLFRNDHFPFVGKMAAADALAPVTAEWTWTSLFAGVSISGDLGYTYGTYELREKAGSVSERGNYARVWKKVLGDWKLVIDVADPLPRK